MRNLKRVLSLGMTAAMITGLMVVGTSAAGYSDVSTEDNVEAIEVLQSVGVMVGDENGDFNPDQLVTRNEMAVVMSNLMEYNVATYAGTSPFTDVPSWAEPYVAACWTNGITAGTSATTYGGDASVTTAQAALMLMKALGYFQYNSDFNGDWQLATVSQGNKINLFHDVDSGVRDAMTRNDVAQLVLNTLESGMVEANKSGQDITVGDITITNSVEYEYVTSQESYARAIDTLQGVSATSISTQGYIVELGEKLYDGDLRRNENTRDAYGRPGTQWVYNLDEVGTYADAPLATYTNKVTKGDLYSLVTKSRLDDIDRKGGAIKDNAGHVDHYEYTFTVYADGKIVEVDGKELDHIGEGEFDDIRDTYFVSNSSAAAGKKDTNAVSGKGVQTEVYLDDDGNLTLVYVNTYLMQATADYNESKDTLSVDLITEPADFYGNVSIRNGAQLNGDDFDIADYAEDDYILYTVSGNEIEDIYPAQVVTGEVTAYSLENSVTLDGTKYDYAAKVEGTKADGNVAGTGSVATEYRVGDNAAVVLDQAGYILYVDSAAISLGNYLYINNAALASGLGNDVIATAYFTDGTKAEITLGDYYELNDDGKYDKDNSNYDKLETTGSTEINGWYSYSVNSKDEYNIREAKSNEKIKVNSGLLVEGEEVVFAKDNNNSALGNSDTILIVDDGDDVTVYTGISNFPDIEVKKGEGTINYMMEKDDSSKTYVAVAFVDASSEGIEVDDNTTDTLLYVLDEDDHYVDNEDNETVYVYNAILDGQLTTIEAKDEANEFTLYTKVRVDSDGYYEFVTSFEGKDTDENGDVITTNEYYYDSLEVYEASKDASISVSGGSMIINGENGTERFIITDDTQINVVLYPNSDYTRDLGDIMTDEDADWESYVGLTGRRLDSMLGDYTLEGTYYVVTNDDDNMIAEYVYIVVKGAVEVAD